jgi:hypothetical protein
MTVRYTGDVEVRMRHVSRGRFAVDVVSPNLQARAIVEVDVTKLDVTSPSTFDLVARAALERALATNSSWPVEKKTFGRLEIRRVFQAPCPVPV